MKLEQESNKEQFPLFDNDAVYMIYLMIKTVFSFSESSPEKQSERRDRKPFIAKYWDFRGSNVEEFQQMGASDKHLQNNDADDGKYFLCRNTEVGVVNFENK